MISISWARITWFDQPDPPMLGLPTAGHELAVDGEGDVEAEERRNDGFLRAGADDVPQEVDLVAGPQQHRLARVPLGADEGIHEAVERAVAVDGGLTAAGHVGNGHVVALKLGNVDADEAA